MRNSKRKYDNVINVIYLEKFALVVKSNDDVDDSILDLLSQADYEKNLFYNELGILCSKDIIINESITARNIVFCDDNETCKIEI